MKFLNIILYAGLLSMASCQNNADKSTSENQSLKQDSVTQTSEEILSSSATDAEGNTLYMEFNNTKGTAKFILGKDTIRMKQDTMASGVRCSNDHYVFSEHHGELSLMKDDKIIFERKNN